MKDNSSTNPEQLSVNEQIIQRREKLKTLRANGFAYPNAFRRDHLAQELLDLYQDITSEQLATKNITVRIAGRIMTRRVMGKASFVHLHDMSGKIQAYLRQDLLPDDLYQAFLHYDLGDIIGVSGQIFKTKTGELSVKVNDLCFLAKALLPLPEKFHGLVDHETRYRQRYLDLMTNAETKKTFVMRSQLVAALRNFLVSKGFLEVETPMLHVLPGGATARPFVTHHNALDMQLYLRIAPELHLKRLVVGGMEKVFEINRNFRNEGISVRHNPEFTMVEFYQAYADYRDLMDLTEEILRHLARKVLGTNKIICKNMEIDLAGPYQRITLLESLAIYNPNIPAPTFTKLHGAYQVATQLGITVSPAWSLGEIQYAIFEKTVEHQLLQPTFITAYPIEVSPLARTNDHNPLLADRFEFFVGGRELGNGFSELNDPEDQAERFRKQAESFAGGDQEAMRYDADYINALEYGLPPTAGEGIGIDRLAMLFANASSIRDVILFPLLRVAE